MFIIHKEFSSGEKLVDSEVVGYFETYEAADRWLLDKGYTKDSENWLGVTANTYVCEDVFWITAHITKLERLG